MLVHVLIHKRAVQFREEMLLGAAVKRVGLPSGEK
jgi:hypothetical protein